mgnify:CR=1 FL=1
MQDAHLKSSPILIVDDEESILLSVETTLRMAGFHHTVTCGDSRAVRSIIDQQGAEVILLDLTMPYIDGQDLLAEIIECYPEIPVIIVTGTVDTDTAVRCMKAGAFDYVVKPVEAERLITAVRQARRFTDLYRENLALKRHILGTELECPDAFSEIVTGNRNMMSIFRYIESIARTSQPVLITGETGVGKELIARTLHIISGLTGCFVTVNAAGLDDNVFSDTLFGHVKGAFTGADQDRPGLLERAAGGTLLLDEIGDLSPASQVKLLRLLQEGEYLPLGADRSRKSDARIVASTNRELQQLQREGAFRKDLLYRLQTHHVVIPPMRERLDDIPLLLDFFIAGASRELQKKAPAYPPELVTLLQTYVFPGNVRELKSMVFDAVSRHTRHTLSMSVFKDYLARQKPVAEPMVSPAISRIEFPATLPTIKQMTRLLIREALRRANGNQSIASGLLGISQQALSKRLRTDPSLAQPEKAANH